MDSQMINKTLTLILAALFVLPLGLAATCDIPNENIVVFDNFDRTNSETLGYANTGQEWTVFGNNKIGILDNQAHIYSTKRKHEFALVDSGIADGIVEIQIDKVAENERTVGMILRYQDEDNYVAFLAAPFNTASGLHNAQVVKYVDGERTVLTQHDIDTNSMQTVRVMMDEEFLTLYFNGMPKATMYVPEFTENTMHGIKLSWNAPDSEIDNFMVADYQQHCTEAYDFGDAAFEYGSTKTSFPVKLVDNGARHALTPGFFLGKLLDTEADGQGHDSTVGDDIFNTNYNNDDEDGITVNGQHPGKDFAIPLVSGTTTYVTVETHNGGLLDAWVDFDGNGMWTEDERIAESLPMVDTYNIVAINTPANSDVNNKRIVTRWRLSTSGTEIDGSSESGEVEDHRASYYNQNDFCEEGLEIVPISCEGNIVTDVYSNSCRTVTCENGEEFSTIKACEKPDEEEKYFYELYFEEGSENTPNICIGAVCLDGDQTGFARSEDVAACTPEEPKEEIEELICAPTLQNIYENEDISCEGGEITDIDFFGGALFVTCTMDEGHVVEVSAYENTEGTHTHELFATRNYEDETQIEVCVGSTCVNPKYDAYSMSGNFCDESEVFEATVTVESVLTDGTVELSCETEAFEAETYDWQFGDDSGLIGDESGNVIHQYDTLGTYDVTCTAKSEDKVAQGTEEVEIEVLASASVSIKEDFPQVADFVFVCEAEGFEATTYNWFFDDGSTNFGLSEDNVYHTFEEDGEYLVTCEATNGVISSTDSLLVEVDTFEEIKAKVKLQVFAEPNDDFFIEASDDFNPEQKSEEVEQVQTFVAEPVAQAQQVELVPSKMVTSYGDTLASTQEADSGIAFAGSGLLIVMIIAVVIGAFSIARIR